jgi:hypothetical protein
MPRGRLAQTFRLLACGLALTGAAHASQLTLVVLDLNSESLKAHQVAAVTEKVRERLLAAGTFNLVERSRVAAILEERDLGGAGDVASAGIEACKILGGDRLVMGRIEEVGGAFDLSIRLVDVGSAKIEAMASRTITGKLRRVLDNGVAGLVDELLGARKAGETVEVEFSFVATRGGRSFAARSGDTLYTGDCVHLLVKPLVRCYVYVVNQDARQAVYSLFPNPSQGFGMLQGGQEYHIPGAGRCFALDSAAGDERIYVVASNSPIEDIVKSMRPGGEQAPPERVLAAVRTRGFASISAGGTASITLDNQAAFSGVSDKLTGREGFSHEVIFHHVTPRN